MPHEPGGIGFQRWKPIPLGSYPTMKTLIFLIAVMCGVTCTAHAEDATGLLTMVTGGRQPRISVQVAHFFLTVGRKDK